MTPSESRACIIDAWKTFASRDRAAIARCFTPDAEWRAPEGNATAVALGGSHRIIGQDEIAAFLSEGFRRLLKEVSIQITAMHADENRVVVEETTRAVLPDGRPYENDYCFVLELKDGRVHRVREYMDTLRGWRQIFGDRALAAPEEARSAL